MLKFKNISISFITLVSTLRITKCQCDFSNLILEPGYDLAQAPNYSNFVVNVKLDIFNIFEIDDLHNSATFVVRISTSWDENRISLDANKSLSFKSRSFSQR